MAIKVYPTGDYQVHFDDGLVVDITVGGDDNGFVAPIGAAYITTSNARLYFKDKKIIGIFDTTKEETEGEINNDKRI